MHMHKLSRDLFIILERFIAGASKENRWFVLKNPELFDGFGGKGFLSLGGFLKAENQ